MRSDLPSQMLYDWQEGVFLGAKRAFGRVTIQKPKLSTSKIYTESYATLPFHQASRPRELPNVKSINWERSVDAEAATCTVVLWNTTPLQPGMHPEGAGVLDLPGWFTYNRGDSEYSTSWGHAPNKWQDWIVPDRVLRTYQGYGVDTSRIPELDDNLVCTGTWLIDDVEYDVEGTITIVCRDFARLLIDQIMFPPVVPLAKYPLRFEGEHEVDLPDNITKTTRTATGWVTPTYQDSSNDPYTGHGAVFGHYPKHAFDSSNSTYWLSIGNAQPDHPYSYEWIQGSLSNATVKGVKFKVWGGPYRCYIGVKVNGTWQGTRVVPYDPNNPASAPNGANERYVKAITVGYEEEITYNFLNDGFDSVDAVRLTFTALYNSRLGTYPYRAGVRKFQVVATTTKTTTVVTDGGTKTEGNYADYVDIVKLLLAYGGFHWPKFSDKAFFTRSDGFRIIHTPGINGLTDDTGLPFDYGRVWADVEPSGTKGPAELGVEIWDKKPLMEGINYVKDILGYNFYIDENAAAVFRVPNIWTVGNYVNTSGHRAIRTTEVYTIDESQTILAMRSRLSSRSVREKVFVANVAGTIGATAQGYNPYPAKFRRVAGWTDQNFKTAAECQVMADLITVRQMWNYRNNTVTIPGFPGIQIDDQVRIVERVTGDSYYHYVKSISSTWDSADGAWTYDIGTHWLGETPLGKWFVDRTQLSSATQVFLNALGKL